MLTQQVPGPQPEGGRAAGPPLTIRAEQMQPQQRRREQAGAHTASKHDAFPLSASSHAAEAAARIQPNAPPSRVQRWLIDLLHADANAVALFMLVVFVVGMVVTSKAVPWRGAFSAAASTTGADCADSAWDAGADGRAISSAAAGLAGGCCLYTLMLAAVMGMHNLSSRRPRTMPRLETLRVIATILFETFVFYSLVSSNSLTRVCVTQLGGTSLERRIVVPARYMFWCATTTTILAQVGKLSGAPRPLLQLTLLANTANMLQGLAAALIDTSFAAWVCVLCFAMVCGAFVTCCLLQLLRGAYSNSCDEVTRRLLRTLGPLALLIWVVYPTVWVACALGGVSVEGEQVMYPLMDMFSKAILSLHMTAGDYGLAIAKEDLQLRLIEEARRAAEAANTAKRDVLRYLFHELRVPLNCVMLGMEDLRSRPRDAAIESWTTALSPLTPSLIARMQEEMERRETVALVAASATDMMKLLDGFLSFEKVESGSLELELETTPLRPLLQRASDAFAAALAHRSLRITLNVGPSVPTDVVLDPHRLRQCIANFLSNAVKFSPVGGTITLRAELVEAYVSCTTALSAGQPHPAAFSGGGVLARTLAAARHWLGLRVNATATQLGSPPASLETTASQRPTSPPTPAAAGDSSALLAVAESSPISTGAAQASPPHSPLPHQLLRISVSNGGPGISAADQRKLFLPFSQIRPGEQQKAGGTGLGLAITHRIVELHGGQVGVRSVPGMTSFFLEIPINLTPQPHTSVSLPQLRRSPMPPSAPPAPLARLPTAGTALAVAVPPAHPSAWEDPRSWGSVITQGLSRGGGQLSQSLSPRQRHAVANSPARSPLPMFDLELGGESGARPSAATDPRLSHPLVQGREEQLWESLRAVIPGATSTPRDESDTLIPSNIVAAGSAGPLLGTHSADAHPPAAHPPAALLLRAMVVDDVASNRLLLARLLQRRSVESVICVSGGHAALATWRAMDGDARAALQCVFCDKEMPGDLDGHDTVAALRAQGYSGAILGVTGNALDSDRAAFLAAGADGVLAKPVSSERLTQGLCGVGLALCGPT